LGAILQLRPLCLGIASIRKTVSESQRIHTLEIIFGFMRMILRTRALLKNDVSDSAIAKEG
jgi:hypothetical protein